MCNPWNKKLKNVFIRSNKIKGIIFVIPNKEIRCIFLDIPGSLKNLQSGPRVIYHMSYSNFFYIQIAFAFVLQKEFYYILFSVKFSYLSWAFFLLFVFFFFRKIVIFFTYLFWESFFLFLYLFFIFIYRKKIWKIFY